MMPSDGIMFDMPGVSLLIGPLLTGSSRMVSILTGPVPMEPLHGLWVEYQVSHQQVLTAAMIAGGLLLVRLVSGVATTVAHEGGHALLGLVFGVPVTGIKVFSLGNAATRFEGQLGLADVPLTLAGHLGPAGFGLLAALLVERRHPDAVLWLGLPLIGAFLLMARNWRAVLSAVALGGVVILVLAQSDPAVRAVAATIWAWLLLGGAVLDVRGLHRFRRGLARLGGRDEGSDVVALQRATFIPAGVWVLVFYLLTGASLVYGASMLFGTPIDLGALRGWLTRS